MVAWLHCYPERLLTVRASQGTGSSGEFANGLAPRGGRSKLPAKVPFEQLSEIKPNDADRNNIGASAVPAAASPDVASGTPRRITLEEAQRQAAAANPMAHLAQLQVEAAKQNRLGAESDYFPKISSTFANFHFNKFMGEEFAVARPIRGEQRQRRYRWPAKTRLSLQSQQRSQ